MVTGEPMGPADESSKGSWISGAWDWYKLSGKSNARSTYSPRSILSSILRSTGLERPKGDAIPEAARGWLDCVGLKALFVRTASRALCTDWDTMSWMAERCAGLRALRWSVDWLVGKRSSSASDSSMSSIEESEARSERTLSSRMLRRQPCVALFPLAAADGCFVPRRTNALRPTRSSFGLCGLSRQCSLEPGEELHFGARYGQIQRLKTEFQDFAG